MRVHPESRRAIVGALVGFAYGSILSFLSLGAAGAGHGSLVPFYLSSAPLGVLRFFGEAGFYAAFVGGEAEIMAAEYAAAHGAGAPLHGIPQPFGRQPAAEPRDAGEQRLQPGD